MSLATEKTKTQWYSNNNVAYDSKEDAEYTSVRNMLSEAALNRFLISPTQLVTQLKHYPDAWAWLQQQIGETMAEPPKETASIDIEHAIIVAKFQIIKNGVPNGATEYPAINSHMLGEELSKHYILVKKL